MIGWRIGLATSVIVLLSAMLFVLDAVKGSPPAAAPYDGTGAVGALVVFLVGVSKRTGNGTVIGVIGGYQQGGDTPLVSYSSPFETAIKVLYNTVTRKG